MGAIRLRLLVAFGLMVAMLSFAPGVGAQATSSVTVHARFCDPGVVPEDPYLECHDNPLNGFAVDFDGSEHGTTDADGNLTIDGLAAGSYEVWVEAPLKAIEARVYCSVTGGEGSFLALTQGDPGQIVPVASGEDIVCDWYWLISDEPIGGSSDATLTIHARTCPDSNVPDDFFATCHANATANIEFFDGTASIGTTGVDGNLVFDLRSAGSVDLNGGVPGEFARNFLYCSSNADQTTVLDFRSVEAGTSATVDVSDTGTTCDWYIVPENLSGITPTPAPTAPGGATQLPNTGVGTQDGTTSWLLIALILAAFGVAGVGAVSAVRVRR